MEPRDWKSYAELVGIAALIASLVFVGLEIRQGYSIAEAEMNATVLANRLEESGLIIDNADIWLRGNSSEELTRLEKTIYEELVRNLNDRWPRLCDNSSLSGL